MKPLSECHLYTFIDTGYLCGRTVTEIARQLCDGGSDIIQLRAKDSSSDEIRRMAEMVAPITEKARVHLVVNDHPEIARTLSYPFCHLGQEDFSGFQKISELSGGAGRAGNNDQSSRDSWPSLRLGLSTHSPAQAQRAIAAGADYIAVGPIFATGTKPTAKPVTLEYARWAAENVQIPWFAIGGITLTNLQGLLAAGSRRVCVVSAILTADNPTRACQEFRERLLSFSS